MYFWLANLIAATHLLAVACVVLGALAAITGLLRRRPALERAYYVLLALVIASDRLLGDCFLSLWEQALREIDQPGSAYRHSFIREYLAFIPPELHARGTVPLFVAAILAAPFWRLLDRWRRKSTAVPSSAMRE